MTIFPDTTLNEQFQHLCEGDKALLVGYKASRFFPFDPFMYLERSALAGAAVTINSGFIVYYSPSQPSPEFEFLTGWRQGCPGADDMIVQALESKPSIHAAHQALQRMTDVEHQNLCTF